jgi:hypothetical protein
MFKECTEARFDEMLGCVPPIWGKNGFLVGEPYDHRHCRKTGKFTATYTGFLHLGDKFYESTEPMTVGEFEACDRTTIPFPA